MHCFFVLVSVTFSLCFAGWVWINTCPVGFLPKHSLIRLETGSGEVSIYFYRRHHVLASGCKDRASRLVTPRGVVVLYLLEVRLHFVDTREMIFCESLLGRA